MARTGHWAGVLIITLCVLLLNILARVIFAKSKHLVNFCDAAISGVELRKEINEYG